MPKKFKGENSKAVGAKERKATKAAEAKEQIEKAAEDALWKDDDKNVAKKNQRKEEREKKKLEEAQRKQEIKLLAQQEEASIQSSAGKPAPTPKVTRFQVQQQRQHADAVAAAKAVNAAPTPNDLLVENTNKLVDVVSASGVDEAIKALSVNGAGPEGGERVSMAAAFRAFEDQNMPRLKKENPTLKLSQLKQRLRKEWQRSPDNPLIQARLSS
ncbi:Coiled-coil domain-containing protein 124 [Trinorchestia longiramus]|nr:Coiled-coil domain-containing protein 124 [Trinorchestia longiramus]